MKIGNFMEPKKLEVSVVYEGLWSFVKKEFKRIDTWAMISFLTYLGALALGALIGILIGCSILSFVVGLPLLLFPLAFIVPTLLSLVILFLVFKIAQKAMGIANVLMINILAALEDRPLPRFTVRDERLSFLLYIFLFLGILLLGLVCFIIPGVIFLMRCFMGYMIMLEEKCSPLQALQKSWEMTRGNFWPIFVFVFPALLISAIPYVSFMFIFMPLNLWVYAYMYNQLKQQQQ